MASVVAPSYAPPTRLKDHYWVRSLKWFLYKRFSATPRWRTQFLFDRRVRSLDASDLAIDCGANVGEFTRQMASRGAQVIAFEPCPYAFARLQENTAGLDNVTCINAAVGACRDRVRLYRAPGFDTDPEENSICSSVYANKVNVDASNYVEVDQIDLLQYIEELGRRISILKIDIEGAEVPLLEAMLERDLVKQCEYIFAETHETKIPAFRERTAQLRQRARQKDLVRKVFLDWE